MHPVVFSQPGPEKQSSKQPGGCISHSKGAIGVLLARRFRIGCLLPRCRGFLKFLPPCYRVWLGPGGGAEQGFKDLLPQQKRWPKISWIIKPKVKHEMLISLRGPSHQGHLSGDAGWKRNDGRETYPLEKNAMPCLAFLRCVTNQMSEISRTNLPVTRTSTAASRVVFPCSVLLKSHHGH